MKTFAAITMALVCGASSILNAQSTSGVTIKDEENQTQFWIAQLPGGQFIIPLSKLVSVARQQYIVDGSMLVYELSIDTLGPSQTRIYFIEPITSNSAINAPKVITDRAKELVGSGSSRVSGGNIDINTIVSKNYPATTHSKTIEYRVSSLQELDAVQNSLVTAWQRGRGRSYSTEKKK